DVSLSQTLNLINGPTVSEAIIPPQGLISRLRDAKVDNLALVREIYLSVLNRPPTEEELNQGVGYLVGVERIEGAQDLMWALMNSPAFLFNR
ncbi:MAG: hypothetical protein ACK50P_09945, partial [Planctomycetaceae bacterium]